eukprot:TRINITY_DN7661_c2_g1_i1.p4 TRINITY_DN7661_c2_g1~~TRINITY_DN7661_c2_g1_i1.p4  ORF type:complete len:130 (+),score=3.32 TRINITY_DN7661_c2_g1_i1:430-819(+)
MLDAKSRAFFFAATPFTRGESCGYKLSDFLGKVYYCIIELFVVALTVFSNQNIEITSAKALKYQLQQKCNSVCVYCNEGKYYVQIVLILNVGIKRNDYGALWWRVYYDNFFDSFLHCAFVWTTFCIMVT